MDVSGGASGLLGLRRKRCWRSRDLRPRAGQQRITRSPFTQISAGCSSNLSKDHHEIVIFLLHEAAYRHRPAQARFVKGSCPVLIFVRNSDYPEEAEGNRARTNFGESVACWWRVDA